MGKEETEPSRSLDHVCSDPESKITIPVGNSAEDIFSTPISSE